MRVFHARKHAYIGGSHGGCDGDDDAACSSHHDGADVDERIDDGTYNDDDVQLPLAVLLYVFNTHFLPLTQHADIGRSRDDRVNGNFNGDACCDGGGDSRTRTDSGDGDDDVPSSRKKASSIACERNNGSYIDAAAKM